MKKKKPVIRVRRLRTVAPAGATPNACFVAGSSVTEAQFRGIRALEALTERKGVKSMENELLLASYGLQMLRRALPVCENNQAEVDVLARKTVAAFAEAEKVEDRLERESRLHAVKREARQNILQIIAIVRSCEEKVKDRCMPEAIPSAKPVIAQEKP